MLLVTSQCSLKERKERVWLTVASKTWVASESEKVTLKLAPLLVECSCKWSSLLFLPWQKNPKMSLRKRWVLKWLDLIFFGLQVFCLNIFIFSRSYCCVIVAQKIFLEQNSSEYVFLGIIVHCLVSQWPLIDGLFGRAFAAGLPKLELSPFRHKCR